MNLVSWFRFDTICEDSMRKKCWLWKFSECGEGSINIAPFLKLFVHLQSDEYHEYCFIDFYLLLYLNPFLAIFKTDSLILKSIKNPLILKLIYCEDSRCLEKEVSIGVYLTKFSFLQVCMKEGTKPAVGENCIKS